MRGDTHCPIAVLAQAAVARAPVLRPPRASMTTQRCDACGAVVYGSGGRGFKWIQQGSYFCQYMPPTPKSWWYKSCWTCWHQIRSTVSPKVRGTSSVAAGTPKVAGGMTSWSGPFFLLRLLHKRKIKQKPKHKHNKGSYHEYREVYRRVAWICELRRPMLEALEAKRLKRE